jgi:integrase
LTEKSKYLEDWLNAKCESEKTFKGYLFCWENFASFCKTRNMDANSLVNEFRQVKYDLYKREQFLENWQDTVRAFYTWLKKKGFAPLTIKNHLAVIRSFFRYWDIPLKVELPRHSYVVYHNRDLTKEELRQILTFASPRDRVIWLVMAESGMRVETAVNLRYWQIKEDFEAQRVPMRILLPSESLKDHVGDRWTFIGEDGYRELKNYLQKRMPLEDNDFVFASEKEGKVKGEQFTPASLTVKFNRLVQKLGIDKSTGKGKPKKIRLHGLRKYFRNNMKTDSAYVRFWMGHSLGTDAHYISRDPEEHRRRYKEGYPYLRVFEPSIESIYALHEQIRQRDLEIQKLRQYVENIEKTVEELRSVVNQAITGVLPTSRIGEQVKPIQQSLLDLLPNVAKDTGTPIMCDICGKPISERDFRNKNVKTLYDLEANKFRYYHTKCFQYSNV